jgi:hypothetical protein
MLTLVTKKITPMDFKENKHKYAGEEEAKESHGDVEEATSIQ